jgi:hypothetical protein
VAVSAPLRQRAVCVVLDLTEADGRRRPLGIHLDPQDSWRLAQELLTVAAEAWAHPEGPLDAGEGEDEPPPALLAAAAAMAER